MKKGTVPIVLGALLVAAGVTLALLGRDRGVTAPSVQTAGTDVEAGAPRASSGETAATLLAPGSRAFRERDEGGEIPPGLTRFEPTIPVPKRTYYVWAAAADEGDGSRTSPWRDLQHALGKLRPGDRLTVFPGGYRGPFRVDARCQDGTADAPIQVVAYVDAVLQPADGNPALEVERAFWIFQGFEIKPGRSRAPGFATQGAGAHDILFDRGHIHGGLGDGIVVGPHSQRVTIANSHIHHMGHPKHARDAVGIRIAPGTREITIVGNMIHNTSADAVSVMDATDVPSGGEPLAKAQAIAVSGNYFQEDQEEW